MNWNYFFRHCISTLLLGPFMSHLQLSLYPNQHQVIGIVEAYPVALFISLIFSTPTYIWYAFLYHILSKKDISILYAKGILISTSLIGIFITMYFVMGNMWLDFAISYSISSLITGIFLKLNFKKHN